MAAAYAAFANGGTYYKPMYIHKVVFSDGRKKEFSNVGTRAMKETTAYMMTDMMKTVLSYGTGRNAYLAWLLRLVKQEPLTIQTRKLKTTSRPLNL